MHVSYTPRTKLTTIFILMGLLLVVSMFVIALAHSDEAKASLTGDPQIYGFEPTGTIVGSSATLVVYLDGLLDGQGSMTLDGTALSGCTVTDTYPWGNGNYAPTHEKISCAVSGLVAGTHTIGASGCLIADAGGTCDSDSSTFVVNLGTADTAKPTISSIVPSGNLTTTDANVSVYYDDSGSGIAAASAYLILNGADVTSGCTATSSYISCPRTGLPQGANTISAGVSDNAGNSVAGTGSFFIDTKAPSAKKLAPANISGGGYGSTSAALTGYVVDVASLWPVAANSGVDPATIAVTFDGAPVTGCTVTPTTYMSDSPLEYQTTQPDRVPVPGFWLSCPAVTGMTQGTHTFTVTESDMFGNAGSTSRTLNVDTTAPSISNLQPSGTISSGATTLSADLSDVAGTGIKTATVSVTLDGSPVSGCTITATAASCAVYGLSEGAHSFTVSASDKTNNIATATGNFTVSTCTVGKPNLSLAAPSAFWASYADYTARKLSVTWTVNNNGSSQASNVSLVSSQSTYSPITTITAMPAGLGNISAGGSASVTVQYQLPAGFTGSGFRVVNTASAQDCAGASYAYP